METCCKLLPALLVACWRLPAHCCSTTGLSALPCRQALKRIEEDTARTRNLLAQRRGLQEQRRQANMDASFQRQQIVAAMEKLQTTKSWTAMGTDGSSSINLDLLLKKK